MALADFVPSAPSVAFSLARALHLYQDQPFLGRYRGAPSGNTFEYLSYREVHTLTVRLATALKTLLVLPPRTTVGICASNCVEWLVTDFACALNDYVSVGLHVTWPLPDLEYVVNNCDAAVLVVDSGAAEKLSQVINRCPLVRHVVIIGGPNAQALQSSAGITVHYFDQLLHYAAGEPASTHTGAGVDELIGFGEEIRRNEADEPYTLIYTSGTTGQPKGVIVPKKRWKEDALAGNFKGHTMPTIASFMALAHGGDRGLCWQACFVGGRVGFVRSNATREQLLIDLQIVQPTLLLAMSHFWSELYSDFVNDLEVVTRQALGARVTEADWEAAKQSSPWPQRLVEIARLGGLYESLEQRYRDLLGGKVFTPVTGGGHTSPEVLRWMRSLFASKTTTGQEQGSRVKNSYGSTEFPGISCNGEVSPEVELELVPVEYDGQVIYSPDDVPHPRGEIRVRRKNGSGATAYWKAKEKSAEVFRDGWYYTGDVGMLDLDDLGTEFGTPRLHIIDRAKRVTELYVEGRSVWVESSRLEAEVYGRSAAVRQVALLADRNADGMVAVVTLNPTFAVNLSQKTEAEATLLGSLAALGEQYGVKPYEIPVAVLIDDEWTIANGCLSATGKVSHAAVRAKLQQRIEAVYARLATRGNARITVQPSPTADPESAIAALLLEAKTTFAPPPTVPQTFQDKPMSAVTTADDFLDFNFTARKESEAAALNSQLAIMKDCVREIRAKATTTWRTAVDQARMDCEAHVDFTIKKHTVAVDAAVEVLLTSLPDYLHATLQEDTPVSGAGLSAKFDTLMTELVRRRCAVAVAYNALTLVPTRCAEEVACLERYTTALTELERQARQYGVRVPYQIAYHLWWNPPGSRPDEDVPATLRQSLGEAMVWCCVSGERIERDVDDSGRLRLHSLDSTGCDRSPAAHRLAGVLSRVTRLLPPEVSERARRRLDGLCGNEKQLWIEERQHYWHLRDSVNLPRRKEPGVDGWDDVDTPASVISRAFVAFGPRPALGVVNPHALVAESTDSDTDDATETTNQEEVSPLAAALGLRLLHHDNYLWLTYSQIGSMAERVARVIRSLVPRGARVAIAGYNNFEWAAADFACALAGVVSVGVHVTNQCSATEHVLRLAEVEAILCTKDVLLPHPDESLLPADRQWSLATVAPHVLSLRHAVLLDAPLGDFAARLQVNSLTIHSLPDVLRASHSSTSSVHLEAPEDQPEGGPGSLFTLLFTSGSSGPPKGVAVTARAFCADIGERVFIEPHVTVSYIPLSHSSDRMKLWEFLLNGGRVGFAKYGAENWLDHERTKKVEDIASFGNSSNNVVGLFRQVRLLGPTAMACPPRIWNGLYYLYLRRLHALGHPTHVDPASAPANLTTAARDYIRRLFGPRIKTLVTGGASTPDVVLHWARAVFPDATVSDSYGTTESGAVCSDGLPVRSKGVSVRLLPVPKLCIDGSGGMQNNGAKGEIVVTSPNLTAGYYGDAKSSAESFVELDSECGKREVWFRTGDLGERLNSGPIPRIRVLGRISAALILHNNQVVFPGRLEAIFATARSVAQVYVHGQPSSTALVAIVVPRVEVLHEEANTSEREKLVLEDMRQVAKANGLTSLCEVPRAVHLELRPWTPANGFLNGSHKLVRSKFPMAYAAELAHLHGPFLQL